MQAGEGQAKKPYQEKLFLADANLHLIAATRYKLISRK